jgi:hypothetical protein
MYKGWDVHQYTRDCQELWARMRAKDVAEDLSKLQLAEALSDEPPASLVKQLKQPMQPETIDALLASIQQLSAQLHPQPHTLAHLAALEKMRQRCLPERGGYEDGSLQNLNVIRLLEAVWTAVCAQKDAGTEKLFFETLDDIGMTCPEGDSHRLLMLLSSLKDL